MQITLNAALAMSDCSKTSATDHEFQVDRRPARVTVVRREMLAKSIELEVAINAAQQVRAGNRVIKGGRVSVVRYDSSTEPIAEGDWEVG